MTTAELQQARSALQALHAPDKPPSKAARFRQLLPDIEASIRNQNPHAQIIAALASAGLHMTESEFRNALCRERKRGQHKKGADESRQTPAPAAVPQAANTPRARSDYRQQRGQPLKW